MKPILGLILAWTLTFSAQADRLIRVPTGSFVYPERLKVEYAAQIGANKGSFTDAVFRINGFVEVGWTHTQPAAGKTIDAAHLHYSLYPEIPGYAPGIAIGARDLFNKTSEGTGYFLAITYGVALMGNEPLDRDLRLTLGAGARGIRGFFMGVEAPLTNTLLIQAEHDTRQLNAALVWQPLPVLQLRWTVLNTQPYVGASIHWEF
ncbi:MAG: hypothetical protein KIT45_06870 [Fimbriimonadia bacterium]|nr:hypothetical protein [Fimbriimonadia bacterium]